jgi:hypothetical protein
MKSQALYLGVQLRLETEKYIDDQSHLSSSNVVWAILLRVPGLTFFLHINLNAEISLHLMKDEISWRTTICP